MSPWWFFIKWLALIGGCATVMVFNVLITFQIVESEMTRVSPIDLCAALDWCVVPLIIAQSVTILCTVPVFSRAWPIAVIGIVMIARVYTVRRRQKRSGYFDPATIIRDCYRLKVRHGIAVAVHFLCVLYCIVVMCLAARSLE
jgi:hypothetical protein